MGAILSPQPRAPANMQNMQSMQGMQSPSGEWAMDRPPPMQDPNRPSSRPSSFINNGGNMNYNAMNNGGAGSGGNNPVSSRTSSESPHPFVPNGHQQR